MGIETVLSLIFFHSPKKYQKLKNSSWYHMEKLQGRFRYFRTVVRPIGIMSNVSFVRSGSSANERPSKEYVDAFGGIACFEVESIRITAYELCEPSSIDDEGYIATFTSLAAFLPDYGRDLRKLQHLVHKIREK